ncbi:DUF6478 family protein [Tateyamaria sp.]|nr:DUF6478 family protein [Tateyamaria sp.]
MSSRRTGLFDRLAQRSSTHRWARAVVDADTADLGDLHSMRSKARLLRSHLDKLIGKADERLAMPAIGSANVFRPHNSDWAWRPELWRRSLRQSGISSVKTKSKLGREVALFHDCKLRELSLRQLRNHRERDIAPYGLRMDVFRFDGSFLSLVVDLPHDAIKGLRKNHLIGMNTIVETEKELEIFARLNIKHGPNTEQIICELPLTQDDTTVEFDLAYTNLNEKRIDSAWVDLIFEGPEMNQVTLRDMTFSRRPRAAF